jgi:uncharacterized membrane protein
VTGLLMLTTVPALGGASRLFMLSTGTGATVENARFFDQPLPVVFHILAATVFGVLGALQIPSGLYRRRLSRHRTIGGILVVAGLATAGSGMWMARFYPWPEFDGIALSIMRLAVGSIMAVSLVLAVRAIRGRAVSAHGRWMLRAYALAMGAGTQVFTSIPLLVRPELINTTTRALTMGAAWMINVLIAEWVITRRLTEPRDTRRATMARTSPLH